MRHLYSREEQDKRQSNEALKFYQEKRQKEQINKILKLKYDGRNQKSTRPQS